ncbi:MAG: DUF89 family protein [Clostridiales bacterium]|nr:DUF89 family protein [Clostridiales bacterium]
MNIGLECAYCVIERSDERYDKFSKDPEGKLRFMKNVFQLIASASDGVSTPHMDKLINDLLREEFDIEDEFKDSNSYFNKLILRMEAEIEDEIEKNDDPILAALRLAMVGNFIDFGAMSDVSTDKLQELIRSSGSQPVDNEEYKLFHKDLESAVNLVYLLDNSGEIVFDKVFIKILKRLYPDISIKAVVRGYPVYNDVTMKDALEIGLDSIVPIIDNGTAIPGTALEEINQETKDAIDKADLIISKGMGNFETLYGCSKNIYYIFLCKCDYFVKLFGVPKFTGMFLNELRPEK